MDHSFSGKNILITGGGGLVGSHLAEELLGLNANVFVLDIVYGPESYFISQGLQKKAIVLTIDLRDFEKVKKAIAENKIDYIFHLGAQALVPSALLDPLGTLDTNIMGTVNILEATRALGTVKGVVVASSDKAYGKECVNAREDHPLRGDYPYDVSKSCTDLISVMYYKTYGMPVAVARFGNIFGPGDLHFDRIIPGIMESIIQNKELQIRSNGTLRRDYLFVKDVVGGYIKMAEHIDDIKGEAFNFSTNWNFSVIEIIEKISEILEKQCKYKILNQQRNEIPDQSLNWDKAKKILEWSPRFTFDQGILESYAWYEGYYKKN